MRRFKPGDIVVFDPESEINKNDSPPYELGEGTVVDYESDDLYGILVNVTWHPHNTGYEGWYESRFKLSVPAINERKLKSRLGIL